jgi:glycosyltransferase involved in cell wall biosynthesis
VPAVSLITPCCNAERYVAALLDSVASQSFADWEHVVVDDGSTDGSAAIVARYMRAEPRLRLLRQTRGGVARARNAGYRASTPSSRYVYFLDADDLLEPDMLQTMVEYLDEHPGVGLAYCDYSMVDEQGAALPRFDMPRYVPAARGIRELEPDEPRTPLLSIYCWAPVMESVSVLRRTIYELTDGWDPSLGQHGEGVDLFVQVAFHSDVHFVNRRLYRYRRHATQASSDAVHQRNQDLKVQVKWRDRRDLPPQHRRLIDEAQAFRAGRLRLCLDLQAGVRYLRNRQMRHSVKSFLNASQTALRMIRRESPWPREAAS